jgi:hypothetical protein
MTRKKKAECAALRKAWGDWMTDQIKKGANVDEATVTGNVMALCNAFELKPEEFGLVHLGGDAVRSTYKTTRILAQLLMSTIARLLELSPNLDSLPTD